MAFAQIWAIDFEFRAAEGGCPEALTKIDADYLSHQDQKRLASAIDRQLELETQLVPASVQLAPGMKLSTREKLVLLHIRRSGPIMHSDLRRALHHYRINSAALSAAVAALVRAGIVSEHRVLAGNGRMKTTYRVAPADPESGLETSHSRKRGPHV